tara:strand:- start:190 stop:417 length:228 start_codon:yes stop_codon:yes gene_type:complete
MKEVIDELGHRHVVHETAEEWKSMNPDSPFRPVASCIVCNSLDIEHDFFHESFRCSKCGNGGGGANFWEWIGDWK